MKNNTIKIFEVLPMDLRPSFYDLCNEENKTILKEYIDVMKQEYILEKQDKYSPLEEGIIFKMNKIGYLCEHYLKNPDKLGEYITKNRIDSDSLGILIENLESKIFNPVIKTMRDFVVKFEKNISFISMRPERIQNVADAYKEYKEKLATIPFEENKVDYVEAGVTLSTGQYYFDTDKTGVKFAFPIYLVETYHNCKHERHRNDETHYHYLRPLDICTKNDYLEIDSKIKFDHNTTNGQIEEIESLLEILKYDKIKYEIDSKQEVLEKDRITPIFIKHFTDIIRFGNLCEYGLKSEEALGYWIKHKDIDYKMICNLSKGLESKIDNPIVKEMKKLVDNFKTSIETGATVKNIEEFRDHYDKFKFSLSKFPFEENKINYIEAGVYIFAEKFEYDAPPSVRYCFPAIFAETYRNIEPERSKEISLAGDTLRPKDICSRKDYLEIASKVELFGKDDFGQIIERKVEQTLGVTKYDKFKYEIESQRQEKEESKYDKYGDWNEIKEEYEKSKEIYDDYFDSNDFCE